jgi:hypothetical protein
MHPYAITIGSRDSIKHSESTSIALISSSRCAQLPLRHASRHRDQWRIPPRLIVLNAAWMGAGSSNDPSSSSSAPAALHDSSTLVAKVSKAPAPASCSLSVLSQRPPHAAAVLHVLAVPCTLASPSTDHCPAAGPRFFCLCFAHTCSYMFSCCCLHHLYLCQCATVATPPVPSSQAKQPAPSPRGF